MHPCCYFPLHWPQWISFPSPLSPPLSTPIQPDSAKNPFHKKSHTHTRLTALFPGLPGWAGTRKAKSNLDFTEARDSEWQWHQPVICKSAPRSIEITMPTPHHSFLQARYASCRPTNSVKVLKHEKVIPIKFISILIYTVTIWQNTVTIWQNTAHWWWHCWLVSCVY